MVGDGLSAIPIICDANNSLKDNYRFTTKTILYRRQRRILIRIIEIGNFSDANKQNTTSFNNFHILTVQSAKTCMHVIIDCGLFCNQADTTTNHCARKVR